jgi:hypothetical protein
LTRKPSRFLVRPKESDKELTLEILNGSVRAKNIEIMEGSSATKVKKAIEEYEEKQRVINEALAKYAKLRGDISVEALMEEWKREGLI